MNKTRRGRCGEAPKNGRKHHKRLVSIFAWFQGSSPQLGRQIHKNELFIRQFLGEEEPAPSTAIERPSSLLVPLFLPLPFGIFRTVTKPPRFWQGMAKPARPEPIDQNLILKKASCD